MGIFLGILLFICAISFYILVPRILYKTQEVQHERETRKGNAAREAAIITEFRVRFFPIEPVHNTLQSEWFIWQRDVHDTLEQLTRQQEALSGTTPILINTMLHTGVFVSDHEKRIYNTDLAQCTCPDFEERQLPCKHIYRLYWELNTNHCKDMPEILDVPKNVMERFNQLDEQLQIEFIGQASCFLNKKTQQIAKTPLIVSAIKAGLYEQDNIDYATELNKMTKDSILLLLEKKGVQGAKTSWSKVKLVDWLCETQTDFLKEHYSNLIAFHYIEEASRWSDGIYKSKTEHVVVPPRLFLY